MEYRLPQDESTTFSQNNDPCHWEDESPFGPEFLPECRHPDGQGFCVEIMGHFCPLYEEVN